VHGVASCWPTTDAVLDDDITLFKSVAARNPMLGNLPQIDATNTIKVSSSQKSNAGQPASDCRLAIPSSTIRGSVSWLLSSVNYKIGGGVAHLQA